LPSDSDREELKNLDINIFDIINKISEGTIELGDFVIDMENEKIGCRFFR